MRTEYPSLGFCLCGITAFGDLQHGTVTAINNKAQTLVIDYGEHTELRPYDYDFCYDSSHPHQGEPFVFIQKPIPEDK